MEKSLATGYVNSVDGFRIGVMAHLRDEVTLGVHAPDGQEVSVDLHVGDEVPLMPGWVVKHIAKPRPRKATADHDMPGAGSGWVAAMIAHP